ncbi:MAG: zinc-ribbon domain-containing protein [Polyangiaceae bacterium]|nr:zinc-ribbon domain-containing protein [Polyangiaceae bacterium]
MRVECECCRTEYDFDDGLVSGRGTVVKCTNCGHQFRICRSGVGLASSGLGADAQDDFEDSALHGPGYVGVVELGGQRQPVVGTAGLGAAGSLRIGSGLGARSQVFTPAHLTPTPSIVNTSYGVRDESVTDPRFVASARPRRSAAVRWVVAVVVVGVLVVLAMTLWRRYFVGVLVGSVGYGVVDGSSCRSSLDGWEIGCSGA